MASSRSDSCDGVSQPEFDWKRQHAAASDTITYTNEVAVGELLLGYPNEYGKFTDRPLLETSDDPTDQLLPAEDHTAKKDFGLNGTYIVLRQLEQDVRGFWQYLAREAGVNAEGRYRLGSFAGGKEDGWRPIDSRYRAEDCRRRREAGHAAECVHLR